MQYSTMRTQAMMQMTYHFVTVNAVNKVLKSEHTLRVQRMQFSAILVEYICVTVLRMLSFPNKTENRTPKKKI